jgi:hypothetical protein
MASILLCLKAVMAAEDRFYDAVAEEISGGHIDKATWTRAFAHSGGDENAAKSLYCRYRAEHLASASQQHAKQIRSAEAKHHGTQLLGGILAFAAGIGITTVSSHSADITFAATGLTVGGFVYICRGKASTKS